MLAAMISAALLATGSFCLADKEKAEKKDPLAAAKCPVSGKAVKADAFVEHNGGKVYFCCNNCPDAFKKDKDKFSVKVNHQMAITEEAKQVKCPLTGKDVNPDTGIDVGGSKVAFCCNNCKGKVAKATGDDQLKLVFAKDPFEKAFKVGKAKAKAEKK